MWGKSSFTSIYLKEKGGGGGRLAMLKGGGEDGAEDRDRVQ